MNSAKCNDINICYDVLGGGFPLVMITGLGSNMDWWDQRLLDQTSKKFRTIIFDNRGAGSTDAPKIDYSIKMFADDTRELMDTLKIERAHVLGTSMGGMIAQEFVLSYPKRVEKLVLCSTSCGGDKAIRAAPEVLNLLFKTEAKTLENRINDIVGVLFTTDFIIANPDYVKRMKEKIMRAPTPPDAHARQLRAIIAWGSYSRLPEIKVPALVMHGRKDKLIPPENARILCDQIPGAELAYFENSAHGLFSQAPEAISTLIGFL